MNKRNLIIGIIILIALVGGVVLYVASQSRKTAEVKQNNAEETEESVKEVKKETQGQEIQKRKTVTEQKKQEQENSVATIEKLIDSLPKTTLKELGFKKLDMSSWKTYRNEKLGFEVKYPRDWTYMEGHMALKPSGQSKEIVDITFSAPGDVPGGGTWRILPREKSVATLENIIQSFKKTGSVIKKLKIDGYDVIYSRQIGKQQVPKGENGVFESFVIITSDKIFIITNDYYSKRDYLNIKFIK